MEYYGNNDFRTYHLAHHGIKGMKWGVRRYQNPDGTLTAAGRSRYLEGDSSVLYKDLKKAIRSKRGEIHGAANRYMSQEHIGQHSKKVMDDAAEKRKKVENTKEYKDWEKRLLDWDKKGWDKVLEGQITDEEFSAQRDKIFSKRPVIDNDLRYIKIVGKGYANDFINKGGRELSIAYVMDLGFGKGTAQEMVDALIKRNKTLGDI